ncbi:hypothetical protein [Vulcanisaeta distributa]|uniref:hypothetical protein n=1 Tax=Vulcanisaeta distributa TaxID=164451 RepID=UPI000B2A2E8D|nr:hypothetical protein [Vulcanisaeta distributa]
MSRVEGVEVSDPVFSAIVRFGVRAVSRLLVRTSYSPYQSPWMLRRTLITALVMSLSPYRRPWGGLAITCP